MAIVYEKLYESKDFNQIDMESYLKSLSAYLLAENKKDNAIVRVEIDVKDIYLGIDLAIPCCLILQELISNAIKHAFPNGRKGKIILAFKKQHHGIINLYLSENGIGVPSNINFQKPQSLGLLLVSNLADQLAGSFRVTQNKGTSFFIDFPLLLSEKNFQMRKTR
jgi:two-component sensor histidine kinase